MMPSRASKAAVLTAALSLDVLFAPAFGIVYGFAMAGALAKF
jgi:hypothetical protein